MSGVYYPPNQQPGPPRRRIQGRWVAAGIAAALLGHLAAIALLFVDPNGDNGIVYALVGEVVVFLACVAGGITALAMRSGNPGLGVGLLVGWAVGVVVLPAIGFGLCVQAMNQMG
jgi:hypothetical protein